MNPSYKRLFSSTYSDEPSADAFKRITAKVEGRIAMRRKRLMAFHALISVAALAGAFPAISYLVRSLASSGVYEYLSIIISDSGYALSHFKDVVLPIADALPIAGIIISMSIILIFINSLRRLAEYRASPTGHLVYQ